MSCYKSLYIEKQQIGKGHYGRVNRVSSIQSGQSFVAKKIQFHGLAQQQKKQALLQVQIHKKLKHKHILQFKQHFLEDNILIMIMDYCQFGDLSVYIKNRKEQGQLFEEALIANLFMQMVFGLKYLHQNKVLHRDLKTQNIFIDSEGTLKLADFGISKIMDSSLQLASTVIGTPFYLSPEVCSNQGYNFKSDIWSLGCILYELSTLRHPFQGDNILILAKKISIEQPQNISSQYSSYLSDLIKRLLKKKAQDRLSLKQILEHRFVTTYLTKFNSPGKKQNYQSKQYPIYKTQTCLENTQSQIYTPKKNAEQRTKQSSDIKSPQSSQGHSFSDFTEVGISSKRQGAYALREKCIQKMGNSKFLQIYAFMKNCQKQNICQKDIQKLLKQRYSKRNVELSMQIAQIIYLEDLKKH